MTERKRTEERVRSALLELEAPDEPMAEERARQVVEAAFDGHVPSRSALAHAPSRRHRCPRSRGHRRVRPDAGRRGRPRVDRRHDRFGGRGGRRATAHLTSHARKRPGRRAQRALGSSARTARSDTWAITTGRRGRRTAGSSASPDGSELRAIDPAGNFRWSIEAGAPVKAIDWSSDEGFRVAYLAGGELRVVTGDGVTDRAVAPAADVPPAWQPESDPGGRRSPPHVRRSRQPGRERRDRLGQGALANG